MPVSFERPAADPRAQGATRAVSVVVRAESAAPGVRTTVESALSLARAREPGTEVVLVHDCADRTAWEWLLELKRAHPELHLIDFGEPYGNQLARLEGARRAHHSHVCFAGPGADPEALARAIREAVPRSRAIAVLREGLGASAEQRLVLQSFEPGIPVSADGPPSRAASEPARRRRRAAVLVGTGCICALAVAAVLELRAQAPSEAAASPGGQTSGRPEIVANSAHTSATTAAIESGVTWSLDGPVAPQQPAAETDQEPERAKPRPAKSSPAAPIDAPSETPAPPAPDSGAGSSEAPAPSSESRPEKNPPAQNGQDSHPAEQSTPAEAPAAEEDPAAPEPAAAGEATPPLDGPVDQAAPPSPPTPPPATPPTPPPATSPATPPATPPADQGPGNGNGNGHAYGHANGNGQGNGNGPKQ